MIRHLWFGPSFVAVAAFFGGLSFGYDDWVPGLINVVLAVLAISMTTMDFKHELRVATRKATTEVLPHAWDCPDCTLSLEADTLDNLISAKDSHVANHLFGR